MKLRATLLLFVLATIAGCGTRAESYSVSVRNDTTKPLTIGFTKEGEPFEDEWMAPEDIALDRAVKPELYSWGNLLMPGKTATTKKDMVAHLSGSDKVAFLRVYRGHINLLDILSISRGSGSRIDLPLLPGKNHVVIVDRDGALAAIKAP
ncbi:hypothetical protein BH10PLA1_BH10PLA1_21670 [soil metagenome]